VSLHKEADVTIREDAREIPVAGEFDVVVCGAGLGGTAAAIAAAVAAGTGATPQSVDVAAVRAELRRQGVVV